MDLFGQVVFYPIGSDGEILKTVEATSEDGMLTITIPKGTIVLDKDGNRLSSLTADVDASPPPAPEDTHIIGLAYVFSPDGATFDPPMTFAWSYDPDTLPEGVAEEDLVIAYYDEDAAEWVELPFTVDPVTHTITALVSRFTSFAIIGAVAPPPPPPPPPAPAAFSVSNLSIQPAEVQPNETVTITVSVANIGGMEGSYTVDLKINGVKEVERSVTIAAGSSQSVSFSITREDAGSYNVVVDGLSGSFTVIAPTEPPQELPPAPSDNWPLIGGIVATVVVAGLLIFFLVRHKITPLVSTALPKFRTLVALPGAVGLKIVPFIRRITSLLVSTALPKFRALVALLGAAGPKIVLFVRRIISRLKH